MVVFVQVCSSATVMEIHCLQLSQPAHVSVICQDLEKNFNIALAKQYPTFFSLTCVQTVSMVDRCLDILKQTVCTLLADSCLCYTLYTKNVVLQSSKKPLHSQNVCVAGKSGFPCYNIFIYLYQLYTMTVYYSYVPYAYDKSQSTHVTKKEPCSTSVCCKLTSHFSRKRTI